MPGTIMGLPERDPVLWQERERGEGVSMTGW